MAKPSEEFKWRWFLFFVAVSEIFMYIILPVPLMGRVYWHFLPDIFAQGWVNKVNIPWDHCTTLSRSQRGKVTASQIHQTLTRSHTYIQQTLIWRATPQFGIKHHNSSLIDGSCLCGVMLPRENQQEMGHYIALDSSSPFFSAVLWASSSLFICHMKGYLLHFPKIAVPTSVGIQVIPTMQNT